MILYRRARIYRHRNWKRPQKHIIFLCKFSASIRSVLNFELIVNGLVAEIKCKIEIKCLPIEITLNILQCGRQLKPQTHHDSTWMVLLFHCKLKKKNARVLQVNFPFHWLFTEKEKRRKSNALDWTANHYTNINKCGERKNASAQSMVFSRTPSPPPPPSLSQSSRFLFTLNRGQWQINCGE